jgi:hypothetical protein
LHSALDALFELDMLFIEIMRFAGAGKGRLSLKLSDPDATYVSGGVSGGEQSASRKFAVETLPLPMNRCPN